MSFPSKKRLMLGEVLENLDFFTKDDEKGPMKSMFVTPPQEADNELSEEDSADEDYTEFDLNNLGRKLLYAEAEAYRQGAILQVNRK